MSRSSPPSRRDARDAGHRLLVKERRCQRLRDTVLDAVIISGRAVSETAIAFGISWWLVQHAIGDAALRLPDVDLMAPRMPGTAERPYRSVRFFQDPATKAWTR